MFGKFRTLISKSDTYGDFKRILKSRGGNQTGHQSFDLAFSNNAFLRYFSFTILYFAQGIPQGFLYLAMPAWMATQDFTPYEIGKFLAISFLPWSMKIVFAPIMDRYSYLAMGRRRPWMLIGQLGIVLGMVLMSAIKNPESNLTILLIMGFVINFFTIIQDIAIDGLAIDVLPENQQARANGLMWGAKTIGVSVTVALTAWLFNLVGFDNTLLIFAGLVMLMMILPIVIRERPGEKKLPWLKGSISPELVQLRVTNWRIIGRNLFRVFILPSSILLGMGVFVYSIVEGIVDASVPVIAVQELGWSDEQYSGILSGSQLLGGLLGMFLGGYLIDRFGKKKMLVLILLLLVVVFVLFAGLSFLWEQVPFFTGFIFIYCLLRTFANISFFALAMQLCWKQMAATQFTLYMTLMNLGMSIGSYLMGVFEREMIWEMVFIVNIVILLAGIVMTGTIRLKKYRYQMTGVLN